MESSTYLTHIENDGHLLVAGAARDLAAAVPCCPDWSAADLLEHTGIVHRHKARIIAGRLAQNPPSPEVPDTDLVEWYRVGLDSLLKELRAADPDEKVFTWFPPDQSIRFWFRRMAHETLIHRVDAEQIQNTISAIAPELAADGIDEVLTMYVGGYPAWGEFSPGDSTVQIVCTDRPETWSIRFGSFTGTSPTSGIAHELDAFLVVEPPPQHDVVIRGPAADIDLWLWGRGSIDQLDISGATDLATRLRSICEESMG